MCHIDMCTIEGHGDDDGDDGDGDDGDIPDAASTMVWADHPFSSLHAPFS